MFTSMPHNPLDMAQGHPCKLTHHRPLPLCPSSVTIHIMGKQWPGGKAATGSGQGSGKDAEQGHSPKAFFGNLPASMPEAEFLDIVECNVGAIATVKQNDPGDSWVLN